MPRRALLTVAVASALLVMGAVLGPARAAVVPAPASPACKPRSTPPTANLSLVSSQPFAGHPRVTNLTLSSKALNGQVHANVLLPANYDTSGRTRYPVLLLLHGHGGNANDWVSHNVETVIGDRPLIVVMPDGGYDGFYSDWYGSDVDGHTPDPPPAWETFHIRELLPWIDGHYRTIADRKSRAIAGLSMGGFGAMSYAARHPDLFVAAGSFSGATDMDINWPVGPTVFGPAANLPDRQPPDECIWGDPVTQDVRWRDHNPTELVRNLDGLSLFVASGNGAPGRFDDPANPNLGAMGVEGGIFLMNRNFEQALTDRGVKHTTYFYGNGTHSWPYWVDDLAKFLPQMDAALGSAPPSSFDFESAGSPFSVFGWTFTPHRDDVMEMTYLTDVSTTGLTAAGSGVLHVDTVARYAKGKQYEVTGTNTGSSVYTADSSGRLHFDVDLGPAHPTQQYAFGPPVESTFTHATVKIKPKPKK